MVEEGVKGMKGMIKRGGEKRADGGKGVKRS